MFFEPFVLPHEQDGSGITFLIYVFSQGYIHLALLDFIMTALVASSRPIMGNSDGGWDPVLGNHNRHVREFGLQSAKIRFVGVVAPFVIRDRPKRLICPEEIRIVRIHVIRSKITCFPVDRLYMSGVHGHHVLFKQRLSGMLQHVGSHPIRKRYRVLPAVLPLCGSGVVQHRGKPAFERTCSFHGREVGPFITRHILVEPVRIVHHRRVPFGTDMPGH